jgi:hypothetical protein
VYRADDDEHKILQMKLFPEKNLAVNWPTFVSTLKTQNKKTKTVFSLCVNGFSAGF